MFIQLSCIKYDGNIPIEYRRQLTHFDNNEIIYFKNDYSDLDTILTVGLDSSIIKNSGLSSSPMKGIGFKIEHLPYNRWNDGFIKSKKTGQYDSILNTNLITLSKEQKDNNSKNDHYYFWVSYRDFIGQLNYPKLKENGIDTVKRNKSRFRVGLLEDSVVELYWHYEKGLIGYRKNNGSIYERISCTKCPR